MQPPSEDTKQKPPGNKGNALHGDPTGNSNNDAILAHPSCPAAASPVALSVVARSHDPFQSGSQRGRRGTPTPWILSSRSNALGPTRHRVQPSPTFNTEASRRRRIAHIQAGLDAAAADLAAARGAASSVRLHDQGHQVSTGGGRQNPIPHPFGVSQPSSPLGNQRNPIVIPSTPTPPPRAFPKGLRQNPIGISPTPPPPRSPLLPRITHGQLNRLTAIHRALTASRYADASAQTQSHKEAAVQTETVFILSALNTPTRGNADLGASPASTNYYASASSPFQIPSRASSTFSLPADPRTPARLRGIIVDSDDDDPVYRRLPSYPTVSVDPAPPLLADNSDGDDEDIPMTAPSTPTSRWTPLFPSTPPQPPNTSENQIPIPQPTMPAADLVVDDADDIYELLLADNSDGDDEDIPMTPSTPTSRRTPLFPSTPPQPPNTSENQIPTPQPTMPAADLVVEDADDIYEPVSRERSIDSSDEFFDTFSDFEHEDLDKIPALNN